jgi:hypothetical protein
MVVSIFNGIPEYFILYESTNFGVAQALGRKLKRKEGE